MSVMRTHVLVDGGLRYAGRAAAAAIFELAIGGFLTIEPGDDEYECVILIRTARPAATLRPEQLMLLKALFKASDEAGAAVLLRDGHQVPVAQAIMVVTRAGLLREGAIRSQKPRVIYRRITFILLAILIGAVVLVTAAAQSVPAFFVAVVGAIVVRAFVFGLALDWMKWRRVFRTRSGRVEAKPWLKLRTLLKSGSREKKSDPRMMLPYELLWGPSYRALWSADQFATLPVWWRGGDWLQERQQLTKLAEVMARVLDQPMRADGEGYNMDGPEHMELDDWLDTVLDLDDFVGDLHDEGLFDDGGGDGHGGDSGDGSSGGDGDSGGHG